MPLKFSLTGMFGGGRGSSEWGASMRDNLANEIGGVEDNSNLLSFDEVKNLPQGAKVQIVTFDDSASKAVLDVIPGVVSDDVIRTNEGVFSKEDIAYKVMKANQFGIQVYTQE